MMQLLQRDWHHLLRWAPLGLLLLVLGAALSSLPLSWTAGLIAVPTGAVLLLVRPRWGLVPLVLSVPLARLGGLAALGMRISPAEVLLAAMLGAWLLQMAHHRHIRLPHPPLLLAFLLLLGAMLASLWHATSLGSALKELVKWGSMLLLYLFVVSNLDHHQLPWLAAAILLAATGEALLGIYQFLTGQGPEWFLLFGRFMRAYGTFEQPNPYAGYLGLSIPLALAVALGAHERWVRLTALGTLFLLTVALGMSWSRGAWLGSAVALCVVGALFSRRTAVLTLIAVIAIGMILISPQLLPPLLSERLGGLPVYLTGPELATAQVSEANYALIERLAHWEAALRMWADSPWLGVGIGNYPVVYADYALPQWPEALGHAHNYYLNIGAEAGLLGLVCYAILWASALWHAYRVSRTTIGLSRAVALGTVGALIALSIHSAFDSLYVHTMYLHVAMLLGVVSWWEAEISRRWCEGDSIAPLQTPENRQERNSLAIQAC